MFKFQYQSEKNKKVEKIPWIAKRGNEVITIRGRF